MDNYVYIVAGLPELTSGFENTGFDYAAVKESIMELLSEKDQKLVELMEEGFNEDSLGVEFYDKAAERESPITDEALAELERDLAEMDADSFLEKL